MKHVWQHTEAVQLHTRELYCCIGSMHFVHERNGVAIGVAVVAALTRPRSQGAGRPLSPHLIPACYITKFSCLEGETFSLTKENQQCNCRALVKAGAAACTGRRCKGTGRGALRLPLLLGTLSQGPPFWCYRLLPCFVEIDDSWGGPSRTFAPGPISL